MMTKQEERAALAKIEKIIKAAGPDSYIGMAFAGCCEIAADNIENDFGESMQARVHAREKELREVKEMLYREQKDNERLQLAAERFEQKNNDLRDQLKAARAKQLPDELYTELYLEVYEKQTQAEKEIENIAEALSYCDPSNEADQESIAHLIKRLQEERPRRDKIKTLLAKLEAIGTKEV